MFLFISFLLLASFLSDSFCKFLFFKCDYASLQNDTEINDSEDEVVAWDVPLQYLYP